MKIHCFNSFAQSGQMVEFGEATSSAHRGSPFPCHCARKFPLGEILPLFERELEYSMQLSNSCAQIRAFGPR